MFLFILKTTRSEVGPNVFCIPTVLRNILFLHAWRGFDTTSATFGHGKASILKKFTSSEKFQNLKVLYLHGANHIQISHAVIQIFSILYSGEVADDLAKLRYNQYMNMISKSKMKLKSECLPHTIKYSGFS